MILIFTIYYMHMAQSIIIPPTPVATVTHLSKHWV